MWPPPRPARMVWPRRRLTLFVAAMVMAGFVHSPIAFAQTTPASFVSWILGLQKSGYTVEQGVSTEFSYNDCVNLYAPTFGSCFGNNPVTPYIVLNPPESPSSENLPSYMSEFNATGPTGPPNGSVGAPSNTFYQLDVNEAIVTVFTLPPLAAYYSLQTYMFSRPTLSYGVSVPVGTNCPGEYPTGSKSITTPDCLDYQVFGYFDNAVNDTVVLQQSGQQFSSDGSQAIAIITTANQTLYTDLVSAFAAYGNRNEIFFEHMPTTGSVPLDIGVSSPSDDIFATIIRYAVPDGGNGATSPGGAWLANAASNVLVNRVQLASLGAVPVTPPTINPQSCNTDETAIAGNPATCPVTSAYFDRDLRQLIGLLAQWAKTNLPQDTYASSQFALGAGQASMNGSPLGLVCIQKGTACAGATADNNAYRGFNIGLLNAGAPAFVAGVFHSASTEVTTTTPVNNATYTAVGAADGRYNAGAIDSVQENLGATGFSPYSGSKLLSGSASTVLSALGIAIPPQYTQLMTDLPNLYIVIFSRPENLCKQQYCNGNNTFVNLVQSEVSVTVPYIPAGDSVFLTERGYMLPSAIASPPTGSNLTGASAPNLESPYVLYATSTGPAVSPLRWAMGEPNSERH